MSYARKILSNTFSQIAGKAISAIISVLIIKIITNYLSISGYGEYTMIYEFIAFFAIAADLGLFTIGVREMSRNEEEVKKIAGNILGLRIVLAFITMGLAVAAAFLIPKYQGTLIPIGTAIAAITTIFTLLNGTVAMVLQLRLKMQWVSLTFVLGRLATLGYMAYIVFYGIPEPSDLGFYNLLIAGVIGNGLMFAATTYLANKTVELKPQFDLKLWKRVVVASLPYGLALILNQIYFRIDSILLFMLKDSSEVGMYGVPMRMLEVFTVIPLYFMNSVLPVLTKALKEKTEKYRRIIQYSWDFLMTTATPIIIGSVILAYPIVFIVSSPEFLSRLNEGFYGSDIGLQILIFALGFQFLNVLFAFILISMNQQKKLLLINFIAVLFNIVGNFLVIPQWGFRGAAFTSVISELIILVGTYIAAKHYLEFRIRLGPTFKILLSGAVMGLSVYGLHEYLADSMKAKVVILLVPVGAIVYIGMLFITGAVSKDMLKLLKKGD
ncbi:MAG: flippase [Patescibacteria group bacterium]|nr:flippase [Patescibacteria group bacterium]